MDFKQLSIETIFIAITIIFVLGAYVGGKVVTSFFHTFGRRPRQGRRHGRRYRDNRYDDEEDDEYSESSPFSFIVVMAILALFAFFIYMKTQGGWQSQLPVAVNRSLATDASAPPAADSASAGAQAPGQNRAIYDPDYTAYTIGEDGEPVVPVAGDNEAGAYLIRVVTYSVWENALNTMTRLQNKGFPTGYWLTQGDNGDNFAVYIGPFRTYKNADWFWKTQIGGKGILVPAAGLELRRF